MITPSYQSDNVTLYLGDCLEILPQLEADVIIADPPYGIGETGKKNLSRGGFSTEKWKHAKPIDYGDYVWDIPIDRRHIDAMLQASTEQVVFGGNFYANLLPASSSWIVWDKMTSGDFADCELAWTSHKKSVRIFRYLWSGFRKQKPEERYHPTQKPLALMKWVVENYTQPEDIVIDPFGGVFTTGVACIQTGRKFIGIEIDPTYYAIAEKRIRQAELQIRMEI